MAGRGWLKPLAVAAVLIAGSCAGIVAAQSVSSGSSAAKQANKSTKAAGAATASRAGAPTEHSVQVVLQQGAPADSAPAATVTSAEIEALPASGRRWEEFVVDAPADSAQANGAPSSLNSLGPQSSDVSIDGFSLGLAFGSTRAPSTDSPTRSSSGQGVAEPSGTGQAWSSGRSLAISEAAVDRVQTTASDTAADGERTNIETRMGGDALHGQAFLFDRQNIWGAQNPSSNWIQQTAPGTYSTVPLFTPVPYTPPDRDLRWGFGLGSQIPHRKIFWFAALDGYNRNYAASSTVKWPDKFFAQPSNDQVQLLGAQLGTNNNTALAKYSQMLQTLNGLMGPVARRARQLTAFGRVDWRSAERHHLTVEGTGADWDAPGSGFTRVSEYYGNHSFGSSQASQQWMLARWEAFITENLLAITQASVGRSSQGVHPGAPSAYEQTLNQNAWGRLPQIVIDSRNGFTIGNPARFGPGNFPDERTVRLQESVNWIHGSVLVKAGVSYIHSNDKTSLLRNQTGTYYYSSVANFISDALVFSTYGMSNALDKFNQHNCDQMGKPWRDSTGVLRGLGYLPCYSYYSQMMGPSLWAISTNDWATFATAQWQPNKLFVVSAGLRWDLEQLPPPIATLANPDLPLAGKVPNIGSNWGPRISFAFGNAGRRIPVLRVGYGMYYGRIQNGPLMSVLTQTGSANGDLSFFMRPTDNLNAGGAPPFPYVLAGEPLNMVKPGVVEYAARFRNPEIHQAVIAVEQSLPGHFMLTASAMLSLGRRLPISIDTNFDASANPGTITYAVVDGTGKGPIKASQITVPFYANWPSAHSSTGTAGRLNPNYQQITQIVSRANSTYEAVMFKLIRYGRRGLTVNTRYIYGHAMDWNPNQGFSVAGSDVLDPASLSHEYGVSNLDARHTLAAAVIYNTPWKLRGTAGHLANNWHLSGIGAFHSGLPYSMRTSVSIPKVYNQFTGAAIVGLAPGINGSGGDNRVYGMGNDKVFYNIGRNTFRYPSAWKADVRLGKRFDLGKMRQLELLAESFNLFNHRNVTGIETIGYSIEAGSSSGSVPVLTYLTGLKANSTAFGQPLSSNSTSYYRERQYQFGLRMRF